MTSVLKRHDIIILVYVFLIDNFPYKLPNQNLCVKSCPSKYHRLDQTCLTTCPKNYFNFNGSCLASCPDSHPVNYMLNNLPTEVLYECVEKCPIELYEIDSICYERCPLNTSGHRNKCVNICLENYLYRNTITGACVNECPSNYFMLGQQCTPMLKVGILCLSKCIPEYHFKMGDNCTNTFWLSLAMYISL